MENQQDQGNQQLEVLNALRDALEAMAIQRRDIVKFNGTGNVNFFAISFRKATAGLPEVEKMKLFLQAMTGAANSWFCGQLLVDESNGVVTSIDGWMDRLKKFFGRSAEAVMDELEARHQKEGEEPMAYVRDVLRLCGEVDPGMTEGVKLRHLQRGLLPQFAKDMILMDPKDTSQFQDKLVKLVTSNQWEKNSSSDQWLQTLVAAVANKTAPPPPMAYDDDRQPRRVSWKDSDEDLATIMRKGFADLAKIIRESSQSKPTLRVGSPLLNGEPTRYLSGNGSYQKTYGSRQRAYETSAIGRAREPSSASATACFNCGKQGHFAKECRSTVSKAAVPTSLPPGNANAGQ